MGIRVPTYLDIGAFDASHLSNTYAFYLRGSSGCCIEANPELASAIGRRRPRDRVLNVAVSGVREGSVDLYIMSEHTLSTTSADEADRLCREEGCRIERVARVPVKPINAILHENFQDTPPDFLSLDIEGMEIEVLENFDFGRAKPRVMCIETLTYSRTGVQQKNDRLIALLRSQGYMVYGDTYVNTIFVDSTAWHRRTA